VQACTSRPPGACAAVAASSVRRCLRDPPAAAEPEERHRRFIKVIRSIVYRVGGSFSPESNTGRPMGLAIS